MFFNFFIKKYDSCNNLTDLGRNNTLTSRQRREHYVTPLARHIIPGIVLPHDLLLGCTLLCRVVNGHTILTRTWVLIIQSLVLTADVFQFFTKNMICVTILPTSGGIILSHQGKERNITSHPSHDILYLILFCHMVCCLVVHCMVVWLTGIQYLHVLEFWPFNRSYWQLMFSNFSQKNWFRFSIIVPLFVLSTIYSSSVVV